MKKLILAFILALALTFAGCSGGGGIQVRAEKLPACASALYAAAMACKDVATRQALLRAAYKKHCGVKDERR